MPNVQVVVRIRPPLPSEQGIPCSRVEPNEISNTIRVVPPSGQAGAKVFSFDKILPETATQEETFEYIRPMVEHALDGLHATIFAYGQTGSGKTHTMEGLQYIQDSQGRPKPKLDTPPEQHGILPRVIQYVFDLARERSGHNPNIAYRLKCTFTQLYNERVSDLLNPAMRTSKEGLKIRWTRDDHFNVENLFMFECENADQMRDMFHFGVKEKVMGSHHMNMQSSRSHCLFTIHVHSWDPKTPECVIKSELTLVDLAGSEKLAMLSQNPSAQLLKESIEINTSLLSLGKVITALASNSKATHIPYRDSKLTKLLKHSLGGNSMTVMLACISPLDPYAEETMSTLMYAGRARNITNDPRVNEDPRSALIRQLREEIRSLKTELEYFRQLATSGGGGGSIEGKFGAPAPNSLSEHFAHSNADGGRRPHSFTGGMSPRDESNLVDKLVESCKMLKNVVSINGQLRAAFDKLKVIKEDSEKREMELNAENIALRERIEMLESIALAEENNDNGSTNMHTSQSTAKHLSSSAQLSNSSSNAIGSQRHAGPDVSNSTGNSAAIGRMSEALGAGRSARATQPQQEPFPPRFEPQPSKKTFSEKLNDYAKKYKNPAQPASYEDYYGQAKKMSGGVSTTAGGASSSQLVQDMERLLKNLPKASQQMVPASLQSSQAYGSLAFGGKEDDKQDLEERRRQRQFKLQQIQEQHNAMQRGFSGGVTTNVLSLAPMPQSLSSSTGGTHHHGNHHAAASNDFAVGPPPLNFSSSGPTTSSGKLFAYLSQEETSKVFTHDQLERLRQRNTTALPPSPVPSSPRGSSRGANSLPMHQQPALRLGQQRK